MINLRRAKKEDESGILEIVKSVLSDYGLQTNPEETDLDLSDIEKHYFNRKGWFAVLESDGTIIGSYGIFGIDEKACELRKMYLFKSYQGIGLGKLMMEDALKKAVELGYSEIVLETNKLLHKAIALYSKYGFIPDNPTHFSDRCDFGMRKEL